MVNCYLTGVRLPIERALVLNRREASALLGVLESRVSTLARLIQQLGPLDELPETAPVAAGRARKRHRLVCPAMAEALAAAFPEARLFTPWPVYRGQVGARNASASNSGHGRPAGDGT